MIWSDAQAPSLAEMEALAQEALRELPVKFRRLCEGIVVRIEDFPDEALTAELGLEDAFGLTGLYQGVALTEKSPGEVAPMPDMIFLYRRPVLDEWAEGGVTLRELVTHIMVHEIGHHFGLSEEAMHEIERSAGKR